jgi:hypothetical protein
MKIIINQGREILLLGSVRESIMTPSETSSEKNSILYTKMEKFMIIARVPRLEPEARRGL